jgi:hypothetical protein
MEASMGTGRHAKQRSGMLLRRVLDHLPRLRAALGLQKNHANPEPVRQLNACVLAGKGVRYRQEKAGAISAAAIGVHAVAMRQAAERFQRAFHDLMGRRATQLGNESHTTCVVVHSLFRHMHV